MASIFCQNSHLVLGPSAISFLFPVLAVEGLLCGLSLCEEVSRLGGNPSFPLVLFMAAFSCPLIPDHLVSIGRVPPAGGPGMNKAALKVFAVW